MTDEHVYQNPFWRLSNRDPAKTLFDRATSVTLNWTGGSTTHQHDLALAPDYTDGRGNLFDEAAHLSATLRAKFMATDEFDLQSIEFISATASSRDANKDYSTKFTILRITVVVHDDLIQRRFRETYEAISGETEA